jgi:hypothetical protein
MRGTEHPTAEDTVAQSLIQRLLCWLCFTVLMVPGAVHGMDFTIDYQPQLKLKMVVGEGRVQDGDAERFLSFAKKADRDDAACKSLQGPCKPGLLEIQRGTKAALAQSLDCSKLISVQAQLVCGDEEHASVDKAMAEIYANKMKVSANKTRLRADQRA